MRKVFLTVVALVIIIFSAVFFSIEINSERVKTIFGSTAFYDINGNLFHVRLSPSSEWQIPIKLNDMGKW
ncbi:MAG: hypothetical protein SPL10_04875, partial [Synergistales bacterium]|nr:hypothetical protein [Synergistales bacterium]